MTDGALLLDKPVGLSSNRALQEARKLYGMRKAGHAGTLDPLASGLLIALFGEATKFAGPLLDSDKEYVATVKLGERTSTGDAEGALLETKPVNTSEAELQLALARLRGDIDQLPPMYSALKRDGVPLYRLARKGQTVARAPRRVRILELESTRFDPPHAEIRVRCSKGTYIRTLAEDLGAALGTGAHISALRRTASGRFSVADACRLEALQDMTPADRLRRLLPLAALLDGLPRAELDAASEARLRNGQVLQISGLTEGVHGVYGPGGAVVGLGRAESGGVLKALRLTQVAEKHVKSRA
jgi:tRNA pseudouridine55 synthase